MADPISIENINGITIVRFFETVDTADIQEVLKTVMSGELAPLRMWVFEKGLLLSGEEARSLALSVKASNKPAEKFALVITAHSAFGVARMFSVYREHAAGVFRLFRTESEALEWLKS